MNNQLQTSPPRPPTPLGVYTMGISLAILIVAVVGTAAWGIDGKFDGTHERFNAVDSQFESVDAKFQAVYPRLDGIELRLSNAEIRLSEIAKAVESIDQRLLHAETNTDALFEQNLPELYRRLNLVVRTHEGWFIIPSDGSDPVGLELKASQ